MGNRFLKLALALVMALSSVLWCGCEDVGNADSPISFTVYGTIVDHRTGEPVRAAEVSLHTFIYPSSVGSSTPNGSIGTAVTGMDGQYEMHCVVTENLMNEIHNIYSLYIEASGHSPYSKEITMTVSEGMRVQQDAAI